MKSGKPEKSVAGMDVLKDIRGLLSTTQEKKSSTKASAKDEPNFQTEAARYKDEIKGYREQLQKQQEELDRLKKEKEELVYNLDLLRSAKKEPPRPASADTEGMAREIAQLELRRDELSQALSEVTELLGIKIKELLKRIGRVFQEAGDGSVAIEFRKGADSLENAENLARFLEVLLGE